VAEADDQGRATLRLPPGEHEIQVMTESGVITRRVVTVAKRDADSYKTISMSLEDVYKQPRSNRRMAAAAAVIILMLAAGAAAYFAMREPARVQVQSIAPVLPQAGAAGEAQSSAAVAVTPEAETQPSADATKAEEERKRAEAHAQEAKANKEKQAAEKAAAEPEQAAGVARTPVTPPVQPVKPTPAAQEACVGVKVSSWRGIVIQGAWIAVTEISSSGGRRVLTAHSNHNGRTRECGLKAGNRVLVEVRVERMNLNRPLRASREAVLAPGDNYFDIQIGERPDRLDPDRRRPRRQRP
jgi:hypothetical protein